MPTITLYALPKCAPHIQDGMGYLTQSLQDVTSEVLGVPKQYVEVRLIEISAGLSHIGVTIEGQASWSPERELLLNIWQSALFDMWRAFVLHYKHRGIVAAVNFVAVSVGLDRNPYIVLPA